MNNNIFVPKRINVGFNNREGTYTGKLAYVIYYDEKGKLRKEASWEKWRNASIPNEEYDNVPTEGFVLNKKVGGYQSHYNMRQTYARVYDPRGFEFEITIPNLLYILENCNCIKGKGLEGEFVYGWSGADLVLMPVESPDYMEIQERNKIIFNDEFIKAKDLIVGATYETMDKKQYVYMGKSHRYSYGENYYSSYWHKGYRFPVDDTWIKDGFTAINLRDIGEWEDRYRSLRKVNKHNKVFWFIRIWDDGSFSYEHFGNMNKKLTTLVSDKCHPNYADFLNALNKSKEYSPIIFKNTKVKPMTFNEFEEQMSNLPRHLKSRNFKKDINGNLYYTEVYEMSNGSYRVEVLKEEKNWGYNRDKINKRIVHNLKEAYDIVCPVKVTRYLASGEPVRDFY